MLVLELGSILMVNRLIKWGLRVFAFGHMIEVFVALSETAYITAGVCFVFGVFDYIASHFIKECDC